MKFNEKLIELRRQSGLSQEEFGYKLNVTRQTVSKWELGQTTPEMDKLIEIGRIFNVSVDQLINESEVIVNQNSVIDNQPIRSEKNKSNKMLIIIVVALIAVIVLIVFKIFSSFFALNWFNKASNEITEKQGNIIGNFFDIVKNAANVQEDIIGSIDNMSEISVDEVNISKFNGTLELYNGSNSGMQLKRLLEEVIKKNKTEERKITVKYMEIETQDAEEIQNLKLNIKDFNNFEATFDYDVDGYINKIMIEKIVSEFEIKSFNSPLEIYAGSKNGMIVMNVLDNIITSNKTQEQKITVKYNGIETKNEDEIKNIKKKFGTFDNCEITYEYDEDGFINKAIIERL